MAHKTSPSRSESILLVQFVIQVFLVGLLIGLFRSVIPALSESEFGVARDSYLLLSSFVIAFGIVKSLFNYKVGEWANTYGRRPLLLLGWLVAIPIPLLLYFANSWTYVVLATILLGAQQGICWSISQLSKLDLMEPSGHRFIMGINEFMGYTGVAIGGYLSAELAIIYGLHPSLLVSATMIIALALILGVSGCKETRPQTAVEQADVDSKALFVQTTWTDRSTSSICAGGLANKFIDVLVWVVFPVYLYRKQIPLPMIGLIAGAYAFTWGGMQLVVGLIGNRINLKKMINVGNVVCGITAGFIWINDSMAWWFALSTLMGLGMGLVYPSLGSAMSLAATPALRGPMMGIYRFWRDFGYAVAASIIGLGAALLDGFEPLFVLVGVVMLTAAFYIHHQYQEPDLT